MSSKKFPPSKGWITAKLTLKKGAFIDEDEARALVTWGKPHAAQFGLIDISRNPVRVIYRELKHAALDPDAAPEELPMIDEATHYFVDAVPPVPFIAKCGNVVVEVIEVFRDMAPLPTIRCTILAGRHFNDRGDYAAGDTVNMGPLTIHWRILQFPDACELIEKPQPA